MAQITWDDVGKRFYEDGIDRGVLYPPNGPGVPWNGLAAVNESHDGGEPESFYFDGIKYLLLPSLAEFQATLEAYTYPPEFEECDGNLAVEEGLYATNQTQKPFGLTYRTRVGNDVGGADHAYKIHLIYNALATPTEREYSTRSDSPDPTLFSWDILATPEEVEGARHTSHFFLDSREVSEFGFESLESILYGYHEAPRLPSVAEIRDLPLRDRPIIVVESISSPLPANTLDGDVVYTTDSNWVYSVNTDASPNVRKVVVLPRYDESLIPDTAYPGDIVYDKSTGELYKLGA